MSLKTKKEAVITYLQASKTNIRTNATEDIRVSFYSFKHKDRWIKTITLNTSELPMKTLGLSLASISTGVTEGGSRWSLKDRVDHPFKNMTRPLEYLMLSLSRQERWSATLWNTPASSWNEVPKVTGSWGKGRLESCSECLLVVPATAAATRASVLQNRMSSQDFILPIGKNMRTFFLKDDI